MTDLKGRERIEVKGKFEKKANKETERENAKVDQKNVSLIVVSPTYFDDNKTIFLTKPHSSLSGPKFQILFYLGPYSKF